LAFHHYLSGETEFFPKQTAIVHVSGVLAGKTKAAITDDDRILVTKDDIMDSRGQVFATVMRHSRPFNPAMPTRSPMISRTLAISLIV
jgi:predicted xylose isomerase-like sugar epimerase